MLIRQISVFMENTTGRLAEVTALLAEERINLRAISIADTADFGILRMVTDQPDRTLDLLKTRGLTARETPVLGVEIEDKPGALARVMSLFRDGNINIEYLYASLERNTERAVIVFKVNQPELGLKLLKEQGYRTLSGF